MGVNGYTQKFAGRWPTHREAVCETCGAILDTPREVDPWDRLCAVCASRAGGFAGSDGPVTAEECAEIRRFREEGLTYPEIAKRVGRAASAVWNHAQGRCDHSHDKADLAELL